MTFPLSEGNEGLVVFASRCIDNWWLSGGVQSQAEVRMHDLSDGFFIPGCFSQAKKPSTPADTTKSVWRSANNTLRVEIDEPNGKVSLFAGDASIEVNQTTGQVAINATAGITLNGPVTFGNFTSIADGGTLNLNGDLITTGNVTAGAIDLETHTHTGVTSGPDDTGPPIG